jgi:hypothetical protein
MRFLYPKQDTETPTKQQPCLRRPPHLLLGDLEPDASLEAKLGEEHVHDRLGVGEPQHHVADVGKPERLDVGQLVEVGLDQEDGQVVHGRARGKPVVDDDRVKAKAEGEEGDQQRDGDGDDVDNVAPGAVGVPQLHGEAEAPLGEGAVLPAEEDLGGEQNELRSAKSQMELSPEIEPDGAQPRIEPD